MRFAQRHGLPERRAAGLRHIGHAQRLRQLQAAVQILRLHIAGNIGVLQRPAGLTAFLGRIARNLARNRYKAGRAAKRGAGELELSLDELDQCVPDAMAVEDAVHGRALSDAISAFLWTQSPEARRMFVRRYFHCEAVGELARTFGVSESKVKSMLFRTRNKLRLYLESEGYIHEK